MLSVAGNGVVFLWRGTAARYRIWSNGSADDRGAPFSGEVEGEAPVRQVVSALDTLVDLVEASAA